MGKKTKKSAKDPGPLLTLAVFSELQRAEYNESDGDVRIFRDISANPLFRALGAIISVARDTSLSDRPKTLVKLGAELDALVPAGYEEAMVPPLTARQLRRFLRDDESVEYVRQHVSRALGPVTLDNLHTIAEHLLAK